MEYKDHSYNQLDEGIISGAGALVKKMNNPALIKKAGDAITRGGEKVTRGAGKVTPEFIKKTADRMFDAKRSPLVQKTKSGAAAAGRAAANVSRKTGVRLGSEKAALGNVIKRGLASPELGGMVQNYTGGGAGLVNRVQDAVFGKDRMGGQTKMYNKGSGSDRAGHSARASRFGASVPKTDDKFTSIVPNDLSKAEVDGPNSNQELRDARAKTIKQARKKMRDTASAAGTAASSSSTGSPTTPKAPSGVSTASSKPRDTDFGPEVSAAGTAASSSSTGSPTTPKAPSGVSTASSEPRDPADRTRNPEGQGKPKGSILGRVAGAIGKGMRHDVNSPGRRARAVGAVAGSINRGIGGASPGRMSGVFDNDPFTAKMRQDGEKKAFADQAQMRRQARELMQLDPSLSYGQALTAVMQQVSIRNRPDS